MLSLNWAVVSVADLHNRSFDLRNPYTNSRNIWCGYPHAGAMDSRNLNHTRSDCLICKAEVSPFEPEAVIRQVYACQSGLNVCLDPGATGFETG